MRCSQPLKLNEARQVKYAIDMGSFVIAVSSNKSFDTHSLFPQTLEFFFTFEHIEKIRISRDFISNLLGRVSRFLQPFKPRNLSFS